MEKDFDLAESVLRTNAVYFAEGSWPGVLSTIFPDDVLPRGTRCCVAIIPLVGAYDLGLKGVTTPPPATTNTTSYGGAVNMVYSKSGEYLEKIKDRLIVDILKDMP